MLKKLYYGYHTPDMRTDRLVESDYRITCSMFYARAVFANIKKSYIGLERNGFLLSVYHVNFKPNVEYSVPPRIEYDENGKPLGKEYLVLKKTHVIKLCFY